jgi:hypothetical protein
MKVLLHPTLGVGLLRNSKYLGAKFKETKLIQMKLLPHWKGFKEKQQQSGHAFQKLIIHPLNHEQSNTHYQKESQLLMG